MQVKQGGFSLVGVMVAMASTGLLMSMLMTSTSSVMALHRAGREGQGLTRGAAALHSYLKLHGVAIVTGSGVDGFVDPYRPTMAELKAKTFLPSFMPNITAFGGTFNFTVRRGAQNDLLGLVCDTVSITEGGVVSPQMAGQVIAAAKGGLRTSIADPNTLNGAAFTSIPSPINGPAIVCAWAYVPNPV